MAQLVNPYLSGRSPRGRSGERVVDGRRGRGQTGGQTFYPYSSGRSVLETFLLVAAGSSFVDRGPLGGGERGRGGTGRGPNEGQERSGGGGARTVPRAARGRRVRAERRD